MKILYFLCKEWGTQDKVFSCFKISITFRQGSYIIFEIMTEFVLIQVTKFEALPVTLHLFGVK